MRCSQRIRDRGAGRCGRELAGLALIVGLTAGACADGNSSQAADSTADQPQYGSEEFGLALDELAGRVEEVEASIGLCMSDAGFEYVPVDYERVKEGMDADKTAPGLSDEEYLDQFGFGVTTQFERPGREIGLGEQNVQIYEGFTPGEQEAYDHTLFGDDREATFALTLEAEDFSRTGGCTKEAVDQAFTLKERGADYFNPGDAALEQDKRVVEAVAQWSECIAAEGYVFGHPGDVEADLAERLDAIVEGADPESLTGPAADALAELQGEEVALAKVSVACEEEHIEPVVEEVESEIYGAPQN